MKFGMNLLISAADFDASTIPILELLRSIGYDGVELPLFDPQKDVRGWAERLDSLGLRRTAVTIRGEADNPISCDAVIRTRGVENTKRCLDQCAELGCETLCGPFHSALGYFSGAGPTDAEWQWGLESMRQVAEHAAAVGVRLAIEPLNRFENYLLTTHGDAARFARTVGVSGCGILYDTFHAHIEEKCVGPVIQDVADVLCHVHISENDRSTPGHGQVRWSETFAALRQVNYDGWLVVEAFGLALPEIAAATKIWRRMYASEEQLCRDALTFMKTMAAG